MYLGPRLCWDTNIYIVYRRQNIAFKLTSRQTKPDTSPCISSYTKRKKTTAMQMYQSNHIFPFELDICGSTVKKKKYWHIKTFILLFLVCHWQCVFSNWGFSFQNATYPFSENMGKVKTSKIIVNYFSLSSRFICKWLNDSTLDISFWNETRTRDFSLLQRKIRNYVSVVKINCPFYFVFIKQKTHITLNNFTWRAKKKAFVKVEEKCCFLF